MSVLDGMENVEKGEKTLKMDYGRSWAVLCAAFLTFFIAFGLQISFGVYFVEYKEAFGASNARTAAVGSVSFGVMTLAGPLSNICYQLLGSRRSVMGGGLLATLGYLLAYFSRSIQHLTGCYSLIGLGLGIPVTSLLAVQTEYFLRWRHFAVAFVTVGSALGLFVFPPLLQASIDWLGWRASMLINAGIVAQICVCGAVMRSRRDERSGKSWSWKLLFPLHLFFDPAFLLLFFSCTLWGLVSYTYFSLIVKFMGSFGVEKHTAAKFVSATGIGNTVGRVVASALNQMPSVNRPFFYASSCLILALAMLATVAVGWTWGDRLLPWAVVTVLFGLGYGLMLPSIGTVILDLFGVEKLGSAQGLISLGIGIGGLSIPGTAGLVADLYSLDYAFLLAGGIGALSAALAFGLGFVWLQREKHNCILSHSQAPLLETPASSQ